MPKEHYLQEGPLTRFTPLMKKLADSVQGEEDELLRNIFGLVDSILSKQAEAFTQEEFVQRLYKEHQRRTADEIAKSTYNYGCDEYGILFATIAWLKGIPTKYIQCAEVVSYATKQGTYGHVYLECYFENDTFFVDSTTGQLYPIKNEEEKQHFYDVDVPGHKHIMVECFTGLDPADAGITSHEAMVQSIIKADEEYLLLHPNLLANSNPIA
jgi:hypothetical protein